MPSFLRLPGRTPSSRRSGPRPSEGAASQSRHRPPSLAAAVLGRSARSPIQTTGLFSPLLNRRVTRPTGQRTTDSCPRSLRPPSSTEKRVGSFGWFRERRSILNRPARRQSRLVPSPTMRQGYHLQRPSAVVPRTTASRPRSLGRARDRRSDPAVPLVLRRIAVAKAPSLIGRVKLTCLTTV